MSELKRVAPQTLELSSTLSNATKKEKGEKGKRLAPSFRFELLLDDKNEGGYSEFTYAHLLKAAEKKRNKEVKSAEENPANGLAPFDEDDDDEKLREIARRFETKYGGNTVGKNRKKYDDDVDLGAGYDENDSFIDNTDAYDEVVPADVTTAYGGFYINSGPLEFSVKAAERNSLMHRNNNNNNENDTSESSDDEVENSNSSVSKRRGTRSLSSSDGDDTEENASEPPPKKSKMDENGEKKSNHEGVPKKRKKLTSDQEGEYTRSKNPVEVKREIMEIDRVPNENQEERKKSKGDLPKKDKKFDLKKFEKKSTTNGLDEKKPLDLKKLGGKTANIDDAIESVVNDGKIDDESSRDTVDSNKSRCGAVGTSSDGEDNDKAELPLLDQLPEDIKEIISKLKKHVLINKDRKTKIFDANVNSTLLHLEKKLKRLDSSSARSQVYSHISDFMGVGKVTIINRAKKLCVQDADNRVSGPIQRLRTIINETMPMVEEKYNIECQRIVDEKRFPASVSDADSSEADDKTLDKSKFPTKRYPWSSEARKLVCEIATIWRHYYTIRKPRKESVETFVTSFLETRVLTLWPKGWMRLNILLKYSKPEPSAKRKPKKQRDPTVPNNQSSPAVSNCPVSSEMTNANPTVAPSTQERAKTPPSFTDNFSATNHTFGLPPHSSKPSDLIIEKKQATKYKEKHKESSTSSQLDNSSPVQPMAKISVVPTAQLMAQKPKNHPDKFNPLDLTSSSLSITPVNDYPKSGKSHTEVKKDVVSITPYSESPTAISVITEPSHSIKSESMSYSISNQNSSSKPLSLKQRILQDNPDTKIEKRFDEREVIDPYKIEHKEKKRDRWSEEKHKSHDPKKRRKEHKSLEQNQSLMHSKADVSSVIQAPMLTKEEQEQRQIEETMAATNYLSQMINDDSARATNEKRKEPGVMGEDGIGGIVQPNDEQDKDVQMVMRSLKELQELQLPKSSSQYGYTDDYHRLFPKKEEKVRLSKEDQWQLQ
ncbi:ubinuclein-2 [Diachasma alloeum]|uniref:ubinuclein-2 n=1 Tax=Diachasma alloeum TaxID=454923 RepID=UPI00073837B5|nr:ubinuclein-2 [Diachasma alloeum]